MVRNLIGARFRHGEHGVPRIGRDTGGQNLLVGQRDGGAARCHRDGTALGVDSKGGGKAGTGGAGGASRASRAVNICTTRVIPEIMRISHILKTIKQPL